MDHVSAPDITGEIFAEAASDGFVSTADDNHLINDSSDNHSDREFSPLEMNESQQSRIDKSLQSGLRIIVISSIVFAVSVTVALILTIYLGSDPLSPSGAVASVSKQCSEVGADILKKGGSAVDAAIATVVCCGVVEPQMSGIGGGGFLTVRDHRNNKTSTVDFRESAPASATPTMFDANPDNKIGGLRVGVPGMMKGLAEAHSKYGTLAWKELITPSVEIARGGFNVSGMLAESIKEKLDPDSPLVAVFYRDGAPLKEGDILTMEPLAIVLQNISEKGAGILYSGEYAQEIVDTVTAGGGRLTLKDMEDYIVNHKEPLKTSFGEHAVEVPPEPSGGAILLLLLNIMEHQAMEAADNATDPYLLQHQWLEAVKLAYGQMATRGDSNHPDQKIVSKEFAAELRNKTSDNATQGPDVYGVVKDVESGTTSVITIIGPNDDFVSVSVSINDMFGSQLMTPSMVILNNALADFSTPISGLANQPNLPGPNKRPFTSMTPAVVHTPGRICATRIAIGGGNDSRSIAATAEVLMNHLGLKNSLANSMEAPRLFASVDPKYVAFDKTVSTGLVNYLIGLGHPPAVNEVALSYVNVAMKVNDNITVITDSRVVGDDNSEVFG